jgi:predicted sugar kinase
MEKKKSEVSPERKKVRKPNQFFLCSKSWTPAFYQLCCKTNGSKTREEQVQKLCSFMLRGEVENN